MNTVTPETQKEFLASLTEEDVQELGYPDKETFLMLVELEKLAGKWRRTKDESVVKEYHVLYFRLVERGVDMDDQIGVQAYLPEALMPVVEPEK